MKFVDVVFDGPPGPTCGRFVEVENDAGASIAFGEWIQRDDGFWALRIRSQDLSVIEESHPWADFLHHRARVLLMWEAEGQTPEQSAETMCMDPGQVRMILAGARDGK